MTLSQVVRFLIMNTAKRINLLRQPPGIPVWPRNYYKQIIRDVDDLDRFRRFIQSCKLGNG